MYVQMTHRAVAFVLYGLLFLAYIGAQETCVTPNQQQGNCILLTKCDSLFRLLLPFYVSYGDMTFLRLSKCGVDQSQHKVCCPVVTSTSSTPPTVTPTAPDVGTREVTTTATVQIPNIEAYDTLKVHPNRHLIPNSSNHCGKTKDTTKIFGGEVADLGAFPWAALLGYWNEALQQFHWRCGGSLINSRYVLTAAHCLSDGIPSLVRLGEHRISTTTDCQDEDCAPEVLDVAVYEAIVHYNFERDRFSYDIGLIRLDDAVRFNGYISPVCLPFGDLVTLAIREQIRSKHMVAIGWGVTENTTKSDVLLRVDLPLYDFDRCKELYKVLKTDLIEGQFCAGGVPSRDSCRGDSGGPIMTLLPRQKKTPIFVAVGLVSFGPPGECGGERPGVYTQTSTYLQWILDTVRP